MQKLKWNNYGMKITSVIMTLFGYFMRAVALSEEIYEDHKYSLLVNK